MWLLSTPARTLAEELLGPTYSFNWGEQVFTESVDLTDK